MKKRSKLGIIVIFFSLTIFAGAFIFAFHAWSQLQALNEEPVLVAEPEMLDFGTVDSGIHEGVVYLVNHSKVPIEVLSAMKSCSCTDIVFPKGEVPPGEKMALGCRFNTAGESGLKTGQILVSYVPKQQNATQAQYLLVPIRATIH